MGIVNTNSASPFSSLEIYRPVEGAEEFIAKTTHYANEIFGIDNIAVVTSPSATQLEVGDDTQLLDITGVGLPNASVIRPDEARIVLLERKTPRELNYANKFRWAAGRLIANAEKIYMPVKKDSNGSVVKYRTSSLYESFDRIGHKYDEFDQNEVMIECNDIHATVDIEHTKEVPLSLTLDPALKSTRMLLEQSRLCIQSLSDHSKRAGYPVSRSPLDMQVARVPNDASERQIHEFARTIREQLPLKLVMRGIQTNLVY